MAPLRNEARPVYGVWEVPRHLGIPDRSAVSRPLLPLPPRILSTSLRVSLNRFALLLLALATVGPIACAPAAPARAPRTSVLMSTAREDSIGRDGAREVASQIGLVEDPKLNAYVTSLGDRLALNARRAEIQYRFFVVEMTEPNAFAIPGGYIYVSRGLLNLVNSEEELANVIAHEIAHVDARHAAQRELQQRKASILSVLGGLAGAVVGGDAGAAMGVFGQAYGAGLIAHYSRDQERDADRLGQELAAQAGFRAIGMAEFLRTLENDQRLRTGASRRPSFFDSHPSTPERIASAAARADSFPVQAGAAPPLPRDAFLDRIDGIVVGENPAEGILLGNRFLHPDLQLGVRFPDAWKVANARTAIGAVSPRGQAIVALELQEAGQDPRIAAARFVEFERLSIYESRELRIGAFPAVWVMATQPGARGNLGLDLTWIAFQGRIFRLTGTTPLAAAPTHRPAFRGVAHSFRRITAEEIAEIEVIRLRATRARAGETIEDLSLRTQNRWDVRETAVVNALPANVRLKAGQWLKIAVGEPYESSSVAAGVPLY